MNTRPQDMSLQEPRVFTEEEKEKLKARYRKEEVDENLARIQRQKERLSLGKKVNEQLEEIQRQKDRLILQEEKLLEEKARILEEEKLEQKRKEYLAKEEAEQEAEKEARRLRQEARARSQQLNSVLGTTPQKAGYPNRRHAQMVKIDTSDYQYLRPNNYRNHVENLREVRNRFRFY